MIVTKVEPRKRMGVMTNSNNNSSNYGSFCSFDNYRIKPNSSTRTIGFCHNDVIPPSSFSDSGYVEIKESGIYKFLIESDDGGSLSIGEISISDSGPHSLKGKTGSGYLEAGFHWMSVSQFDIGAQELPDGSYSKNSSALYSEVGAVPRM